MPSHARAATRILNRPPPALPPRCGDRARRRNRRAAGAAGAAASGRRPAPPQPGGRPRRSARHSSAARSQTPSGSPPASTRTPRVRARPPRPRLRLRGGRHGHAAAAAGQSAAAHVPLTRRRRASRTPSASTTAAWQPPATVWRTVYPAHIPLGVNVGKNKATPAERRPRRLRGADPHALPLLRLSGRQPLVAQHARPARPPERDLRPRRSDHGPRHHGEAGAGEDRSGSGPA